MKKRVLYLALIISMFILLIPVISIPVSAALPKAAAGQPYDGVDFNALVGHQVYFGRFQHAKTLDKGDWGGTETVEIKATPVLYNVMGEDPYEGNGTMTLMSEYVIATRVFKDTIYDGRNEWPSSNLRSWLNKRDGLLQSGFHRGEDEIVVPFAVVTGSYYNGTEQTSHRWGQTITFPVTTSDRIYIPWSNDHTSKDRFVVSWSAGNNTAWGKIANPATTLKNGTPVRYWTRTPRYDFFVGHSIFTDEGELVITVTPDGKTEHRDADGTQGVRPIFRIDPKRIIFVSEVLSYAPGRSDVVLSDSTNYIAGTSSKKRYKLTLLSDEMIIPTNVRANQLDTSGKVIKTTAVGPQTILEIKPGENYRLTYNKGYGESAYKIVDNKTRKIVGYATNNDREKCELSLKGFDGKDLPDGDYIVYFWYQQTMETNSTWAGTPVYFTLRIKGDQPINSVSITGFDSFYAGKPLDTTVTGGVGYKVTAVEYLIGTVVQPAGEDIRDGQCTFRFRLEAEKGYFFDQYAYVSISGQSGTLELINGTYYAVIKTTIDSYGDDLTILAEAGFWQSPSIIAGEYIEDGWIIVDKDSVILERKISPNHTVAQYDTIYTLTVTVAPKAGYRYGTSTMFYIDQYWAVPDSWSENHAVLTYTYKKTASATKITAMNIAGISNPVKYAVPDSDVSPLNHSTLRSLEWSPGHDVFQPDTAYTATLTYDANFGYDLSGLSSVTINGNNAVIKSKNADTAVISYTFPKTASVSYITYFPISNVGEPVVDGIPTNASDVVLPADIDLVDFFWDPVETVFRPDIEYTAVATLRAKDGYEFTAETKVDMGGKSCIAMPIGKDMIEVTCTFPAMAVPAMYPFSVSYPGGVSYIIEKDEKLIISAVHNIPTEQIGTIGYNWLVSPDDDINHAVNIDGAESETYDIPSDKAGEFYYFCVIANNKYGMNFIPSSESMTSVKVIVNGEPEEEPEEEVPYVFPFTDVAEDAWYRKDVETAHKSGLINGKTETTFAPDDNMTVAEAVKLAACMHQLYHEKSVTLVNGEKLWYSTFMQYALDNKIIESDLTDRANERITRKEFVYIFHAALPVSEYIPINTVNDGKIPDVDPAVMGKYAPSIYTFYRAGILVGSDTLGTFNPESNIKRSEVAAILTRMFDITERKSIMLE